MEADQLGSQTRTLRYSDSLDWLHLFEQESSHLFVMETADINSPMLTRIMVQPALQIICRGAEVEFRARTALAHHWFDWLVASLDGFTAVMQTRDVLIMRCPARRQDDVVDTLKSLDALRVFQNPEFEQAGSLMLAGHFGFDLVSYWQREDYEVADLSQPDFEFWLAECWLELDHQQQLATLHGCGLGLDEFDWSELDYLMSDAADRYEWMLNQQIRFERQRAPLQSHVTDAALYDWLEQARRCVADGQLQQLVLSRSYSCSCADPMANFLQVRIEQQADYRFFIKSPGYTAYGLSSDRALKLDRASGALDAYPVIGAVSGCAVELEGHSEDDHSPLLWLNRALTHGVQEKALMRLMAALADVDGSGSSGLTVDRHHKHSAAGVCISGQLPQQSDALYVLEQCFKAGAFADPQQLDRLLSAGSLVDAPRDLHGGTFGVLLGNGDMDSCVASHCAVIRDGIARLQAGIGIDHNAAPANEELPQLDALNQCFELQVSASALH